MGQYNKAEYFPILIASLSESIPVPFNCYLLLEVNQRILPFSEIGEMISPKKKERLLSFKFEQLYLHQGEMEAYRAFLRAFLKSPAGKVYVEKLPPGEAVSGVPADIASQFFAPHPVARALTTDQEVIEILRGNVQALETQFHLKEKLTPEEEAIIKDATAKISEGMARVKS